MCRCFLLLPLLTRFFFFFLGHVLEQDLHTCGIMTVNRGFHVGDSEAALLVSRYLLTATWGLMLVFPSPWGLVKLPANHHPFTQAKRQERPLKMSQLRSLLGMQARVQCAMGKYPYGGSYWRLCIKEMPSGCS